VSTKKLNATEQEKSSQDTEGHMENINNSKNSTESTLVSRSVPAIEFTDVVVYNEMADQTSVRLNLINQVHAQLSQLETKIQRREFVMKEIFHTLRLDE
jgi:high-affinity Fe2+/Pb2+ permease